MRDLITALIDCLRQEAVYYRQLAVSAEQQKELLMAGNIDSLPENVRTEERVVFSLTPLIAKRNELLAKMAKVLGEKTMTLTDAVKKSPAAEGAEELKGAVLDLIQSAKGLDQINRSNEKLLTNALSYVDFTLKVVANGGRKRNFSPAMAEEKTSSFVNRIV